MKKKLLIATLIALSGTLATAAQANEVNTNETILEVSGEGIVKAMPNEVILNFSITDTQKDAKLARDNVEKVIKNFADKVSRAGIEDNKFIANSLYVNPKYSYDKNSKRTLEGYEALRDVKITLDDFSMISKIVDIAMKAGINGMSGLRYSISDQSTYNDKALELAIQNAREKAQKIAKGFDMQVVKPKKITLSQRHNDPVVYRAPVRMLKAAEVAEDGSVYNQEELKVTQEVYVEFILK